MNAREAESLIAGAVPRAVATWADIGAGEGTFTRALALRLEPGSRVFAVDQDPRALAVLGRSVVPAGIEVCPVRADFTRALALPGVEAGGLDGMVFANALHFARDAGAVLSQLVGWVRSGGRLVVIEYDGRSPSRWVPFPLSPARLAEIAPDIGLEPPRVVATRPSAYGGRMYVAVTGRP